ncbi:mitochondrial 37S ribosomal mS29 domain-containing protein [Calcarisporiella thermophila]|uniref:mitochondrial 37S ribosomal mS29 domain-containing protein n=1 Tax=Calcarisporiella thermophila TaxID=911321 RepID=UPI00374416E7
MNALEDLVNERLLIFNFKENLHLGGGPVETWKVFFSKKQRSCLGTVLLSPDGKKEYFDFFSDILSHDVKDCLEVLFSKLSLSEVDTLEIWTDCGPHFRCQELTQYLLNEFPSKYSKKVRWNFFAEYHGKSWFKSHFGFLSRWFSSIESTCGPQSFQISRVSTSLREIFEKRNHLDPVLEGAKTNNGLVMNFPEWIEINLGPDSLIPDAAVGELEPSSKNSVNLLHLPVMSEIEDLLDIAENRQIKNAIRGPAGTGKSCLMLYAVFQARKRGWLVMYIPQAKRLMDKEHTISTIWDIFDTQLRMSKNRLKDAADVDRGAKGAFKLLEKFELNEPTTEEDCISLFLLYVNYLRRIRSIPVLIAIDQWNAFIEKASNNISDHPIARHFGSFSNFSVYILPRRRQRGQGSETVASGLIPEKVLETLDFELREYYAGRIQSLLARHVDDLTRISELQFIARIIVGEVVSFNLRGKRFEAAGLISNDGTIVCRQAREAILSVFNVQRRQLIRDLASFPQTSWYSHEVAFFSAFQPYGKSAILPVKSPMGNPLPEEVALKFRRVRQQEHTPKVEVDIACNKLELGDLLILSIGHITLDFVGLTFDELLILGQISLEKYDGLRHNFWNLFEKKIGDLSMVNFYRRCAGKPLLNQEQKSLPQDTIYLYITTSTKYASRRSKAANDPVLIVDGMVLANMFSYPRELIPDDIQSSTHKRQRRN